MISFEALVDKYIPEPKHVERAECTNSIICECQRRSCMGYTVKVDTFWRSIKRMESI